MGDGVRIWAATEGFCLFAFLLPLLFRFPTKYLWMLSPLQTSPLTLFSCTLEVPLLWHRQLSILPNTSALQPVTQQEVCQLRLPPSFCVCVFKNFMPAFSQPTAIHWTATPKVCLCCLAHPHAGPELTVPPAATPPLTLSATIFGGFL